MNNVLIFAGGAGRRMNSRSKPKQFLKLYGKEIIIHTLENFQNHPEVDNIVVVCIKGWITNLQKLLAQYNMDKVRLIVAGGKTGQESIYNGLCALADFAPEDSIVLVHDGVRPFVTDTLISDCIKSVKKYGSAITVTPATETIVELSEKKIQNITDRSKCYLAKAPQCFYLGELLEAHEKAIKDGNTNMIDSASLMKHYGHNLYVVPGNADNIKITTPADFYSFRALYDARENQQIFGL
ncbi:MAG: 2-C-methyl-D-erythritol 4-phosphate cytidylyltransferase [Spirochaetia bacterium]|nr:2-C-methyl-D-erythritol 4-phosphate cytidylyltransferase [Spirochaetia bacterium]